MMFSILTIGVAAAVAAAPFAKMAADALEAYVAYVLRAASGEEVDPTEGMQLARDAGRSLIQLQADVECASNRFERHAAFTARDWDAEIAAAVQQYRDAHKAAQEADAAVEAARATSKAAHERVASLMHLRGSLDTQRQKAVSDYNAAMRADAGAERDTTDWANFKLA